MCRIDDKTQVAETQLSRTDDAGSGYDTKCDAFTLDVWNAKRTTDIEQKVDALSEKLDAVLAKLGA